MRVSVPNIPKAILTARDNAPRISVDAAISKLSQFLKDGNVTLLTGAGVSVDSGIRAYRGEDGRYMNPNYKPILYHEVMDLTAKGHVFRQRYWLRSYLGYPPVRNTKPNTTHFALAMLQHKSYITRLITQNVDGLHHKALTQHTGSRWTKEALDASILELHGTLFSVRCQHGHVVHRDTFQDWLSMHNPKWKEFADELERTGDQLRTNPDGDVAIEHLGISCTDFVIPECPTCFVMEGRRNIVHKPGLIFFGESIPEEIRLRSYHDIEHGDKLLIIGTTIATYSAFRLLKHALALNKPVMTLNVGPSRADNVPGVEKIDISSGIVMSTVAKSVIGPSECEKDLVLWKMLNSGVVTPPAKDDNDRAPRAVG